jgi:EAL domain-containing protein (putative c-di-GMP-specific phosphodiesterase class I)
VHEISSASDESRTASAVISMGRRMRKRVIAEGVETAEQLAYLKEEGCEEGQGYYLGRPMIADEFSTLLNASGA